MRKVYEKKEVEVDMSKAPTAVNVLLLLVWVAEYAAAALGAAWLVLWVLQSFSFQVDTSWRSILVFTALVLFGKLVYASGRSTQEIRRR